MSSCQQQLEELKVVTQQIEEQQRKKTNVNDLKERSITLPHQNHTLTATLRTYEELEAHVWQWALATQLARERDWRAEEANRSNVAPVSVETVTTGGPSNRGMESGLSSDQRARQAERQALPVRVQSMSALEQDNSALNKRVAELSIIEVEYRTLKHACRLQRSAGAQCHRLCLARFTDDARRMQLAFMLRARK